MLFEEFTEQSNIVDCYPFLIMLTIIGELLIWPFLLFFVQYLTKERENYSWKDLMYFIPFFVGLIWRIPFMNLSDEEKLSYFSNGIPYDVALFVAYKIIVTLLFLAIVIKTLNRKINLLEPYTAFNKKNTLIADIKKMTLVIGALFLLAYLLFFIDFFYLSNYRQVSSLLLTSILYFFGVLVYRNPHLFKKYNYSKTIVDFFDGKELDYIDALQKLFREKQPFLNEKLTIKDVAQELNLSSQQLSYIINRHLEVNFLDFVNTYRIVEVMKQFNRKTHKDYTLLSIALESGFNSKASFNRIFKKHTGVTPSNYIKNL